MPEDPKPTADLGTKHLSSNFGPQPGDDITPDEFRMSSICSAHQHHKPGCPLCEADWEPSPEKVREFKMSRLPHWLQRLLGSPVQPGIITDRSGESRLGLWVRWKR